MVYGALARRRGPATWFRTGTAAAVAAVVVTSGFVPAEAAAGDPSRLLVFTRTTGFRHDSIAAGVQAVTDLGRGAGLEVETTEDPARFSAAGLADVAAVVFLNTTGDVLDAGQQSAFEAYVRGGGGYVGVHAAADTEYDWPFYGELVGAWFASHPAIQPARVLVEDRAHAATDGLAAELRRSDEWYSYRTDPRATARVLLSLDESSYSGGAMGADHPISWCKGLGAGRSFYTGFGHTSESFAEPAVRTLLRGGIRWAAGQVAADCSPDGAARGLYDGWTDGWTQVGSGGFTDADGALMSRGGTGALVTSTRTVGAGSLRLAWRADVGARPTVRLGLGAGASPGGGFDVRLDTGAVTSRSTGAALGTPGDAAALRNGGTAWNDTELRIEQFGLQVLLNGTVVNVVPSSRGGTFAGRVGLVDGGTGVSFRDVRALDSPTGSPIQAESAAALDGTQLVDKASAHGGRTIGFIDPGFGASYAVALDGVTGIRARVVSGGPGGTIAVHANGGGPTPQGTLSVANTGGWNTYEDVATPLVGIPPTGNGGGSLVLRFGGLGGGLFDVDDFTLIVGGTDRADPRVGLGGRCLDVQSGSSVDGTPVQLWSCNGSAAQAWAPMGDAVTTMGKCLDVAGGSTAAGARLQLWRCNGTGAQQWLPTDTGSLVNPRSGACVDVRGGADQDGAAVQLWTCNQSPAQRWATGAGTPLVSGQSGKCLDVAGGARADGAPVQTWDCNGSPAQRWVVGTGENVVNPQSGRCLDVQGGGGGDGARIQLWTCNGSGAQRWLPGGGGTVVNPQSGRCLDVSGPDAVRTVPLQLWSCHGGTNQRWSRAGAA